MLEFPSRFLFSLCLNNENRHGNVNWQWISLRHLIALSLQ